MAARSGPAGGTIEHEADPARHLYLVSSAPITVNGVSANARDGIAITGESHLEIVAGNEPAELVLVDAR